MLLGNRKQPIDNLMNYTEALNGILETTQLTKQDVLSAFQTEVEHVHGNIYYSSNICL